MSEPSYAERYQIEYEIMLEQRLHEETLSSAKSALIELLSSAKALGWSDLDRHNLESALTTIERRTNP